jgi:gamma-glutamylcyclotransferase (GGCT)/AIG2-like uncharacterized protein YtfP
MRKWLKAVAQSLQDTGWKPIPLLSEYADLCAHLAEEAKAGAFAYVFCSNSLCSVFMTPADPSFLAVYGSLRRRSLAKQPFFILRHLQFYGYGIMRGLLLIQSGYPGVLEEAGLVRVEIFRLRSEDVWETLDHYEGYQPELRYRSLFYRKQVSLLQPRIRAWVYFLGREVPRGRQMNAPHVAKDFYLQV